MARRSIIDTVRRVAWRIGASLWLSVVLLVLALLGVGMALLLVLSSTGGSSVEGRPQRRFLHRQPGAHLAKVHSLGEAWSRAAVHEAQSVEAFELLAQQLVRVGAPSELARRCRQAAADERRHATICRAIARDLGAVDHGARPCPDGRAQSRPPAASTRPWMRSIRAMQLGIESVLDGVLDEGFSARLLEQGAGTAHDARLRARVRSIAADEAGHAALAQDIVEWSVAEVGLPARIAVRCARLRVHLPRRYSTMPPLPDADLAAAGLVGARPARRLWKEHVLGV